MLGIGNMHLFYSILPRCSVHHLPSTFAASTTGPSPLKMRAFSSISSTSSSSWCMVEYCDELSLFLIKDKSRASSFGMLMSAWNNEFAYMSKYCGIPKATGSTASRKKRLIGSLSARLIKLIVAFFSSPVIFGDTALGHSFQ